MKKTKGVLLGAAGIIVAILVIGIVHYSSLFSPLGAGADSNSSGFFKTLTANVYTSLFFPQKTSALEVIPIKNIYAPALKKGTQTLSGVLNISHFDDFAGGKDVPTASIQIGQNIISLNVTDDEHEALESVSGKQVTLAGSYDGSKFSITTPIATIKSTAASIIQQNQASRTSSTTATTPPPHKLIVILYKFSNEGNPPYSKEDVRKNYFDANPGTGVSMSQFLSDSTYGNITLTGKTSADGSTDIHGWYTVPDVRTGCGTSAVVHPYQEASAHAIQAAIADGVQIDNDDFVAVGTFTNGCATGGEATDFALANNGVAREVIMSDMLNWGNTLHEFGHVSVISPNGGTIGHSHSIECSDSLNNDVPYGDPNQNQCEFVEYGSPFSVMGGGGQPKMRLLDGANRSQAGYLSSANYITASSSGIYDISKINYPNAQILQVPVYGPGLVVNNQAVHQSTLQSNITVEARDFLPFEQGTDTGSQQNTIILDADKSSIIENENSKKFLAPGESSTIENQHVTVTDMGQTPNDPTKVRVEITYSTSDHRPYQEKTNLSYSLSPSLINVSSSGSFMVPPLRISNSDPFNTVILNNGSSLFSRIYPQTVSQGSFPSTLFSNSSLTSEFIAPRQTIQGPLFVFAALSSGLLNQSRWIYKESSYFQIQLLDQMHNLTTITEIAPPVVGYYVHGSFTNQKLMDLGVIFNRNNAPVISNSAAAVIPQKATQNPVNIIPHAAQPTQSN